MKSAKYTRFFINFFVESRLSRSNLYPFWLLYFRHLETLKETDHCDV